MTEAVCCWPTSCLGEPPPVDFILHHIGPVKEAATKVEIQRNGIPQPRNKQAVVPLVKVYPSYLVTNGENDESLKGI